MKELERLLRKISSSAYVSGLNDTEHHEDEDKAKQAILDMFEEKDKIIECAKTYTGVEGYPCPLCTYEYGVWIKDCAMHARIVELEADLSKAQREVEE